MSKARLSECLNLVLDIIAIIIAFLIISSQIRIAGNSLIAEEGTPRYTTSYLPTITAHDIEDPTEEETCIISEVKTAVKDKLSVYDYLNWDAFAEIKFKICLFDCGENDTYSIGGIYRDTINTVLINRDEFRGSEIHKIIAHEIVHALITNDYDNQFHLLGEGLTEYFAQIVYPTPYVAYHSSYRFAECAATIHGPDAVLRSYMRGEYAALIESDLGEPGIKYEISKQLPIVEFSDDSDTEDYTYALEFIDKTINRYREISFASLSLPDSHDLCAVAFSFSRSSSNKKCATFTDSAFS